jgi:hypothetical protein
MDPCVDPSWTPSGPRWTPPEAPSRFARPIRHWLQDLGLANRQRAARGPVGPCGRLRMAPRRLLPAFPKRTPHCPDRMRHPIREVFPLLSVHPRLKPIKMASYGCDPLRPLAPGIADAPRTPLPSPMPSWALVRSRCWASWKNAPCRPVFEGVIVTSCPPFPSFSWRRLCPYAALCPVNVTRNAHERSQSPKAAKGKKVRGILFALTLYRAVASVFSEPPSSGSRNLLDKFLLRQGPSSGIRSWRRFNTLVRQTEAPACKNWPSPRPGDCRQAQQPCPRTPFGLRRDRPARLTLARRKVFLDAQNIHFSPNRGFFESRLQPVGGLTKLDPVPI